MTVPFLKRVGVQQEQIPLSVFCCRCVSLVTGREAGAAGPADAAWANSSAAESDMLGLGKKPIDPRDGKPGNMTARSSMSEQDRKRRMAQAPPVSPRHDLTKKKGHATYSTVMTGRGLGVLDWVPFTPMVARRWAWEPPEVPPSDTSLDDSYDGELTSIEQAFIRWGRTAPKWMIKLERKYNARFKKKKRRRKKKKKEEEEEEEDNIPYVLRLSS